MSGSTFQWSACPAVALQPVRKVYSPKRHGGDMSLTPMVAPRYSIVVGGQQCFLEPMVVWVMFIANGRSVFLWS
jgi:hypothetical protein